MVKETTKPKLHKKRPRKIEAVNVLPLHGISVSFDSALNAIRFLAEYRPVWQQPEPLVRYEIVVRYTDGVRVEGAFPERESAVEFLDNRHKGLM